MDDRVKPFTTAGKSRSLLGLVSRDWRQDLLQFSCFPQRVGERLPGRRRPDLRRASLGVSRRCYRRSPAPPDDLNRKCTETGIGEDSRSFAAVIAGSAAL